MRRPLQSRSYRNPHRPDRRGLSPLAATALGFVLVALAVVSWLAVSGAPDHRARPPAVSIALPTDIPAPEPAPPSGKQAKAAAAKPVPKGAAKPPPSPPPAPQQHAATGPASAAPPKPAPAPPPPTRDQAARDKLSAAAGGGLRPAPDPTLIERSRVGPLPKISKDGRKPWQAYARPFDSTERRARIAIVIANLGLSGAATEAAIQRLPGAVTLSFAPYAKGLSQWIALARAAGHEVLLDLPMEPINFPANDPGPHTLLTTLTKQQNLARLHWLLGRVTGYVGVMSQMGSRFTTSPRKLRPVLAELKRRGLLFLDSRSSLRSVAAKTAADIGLPRAINNNFIDSEAARGPIDERLAELERIAKASGFAIGIGQPYPVTIDRLVHWTGELEGKNLVLAPVSAMVDAQPN